MTAPFDFSQLDDHTLKDIIRKFNLSSGVKLYRSCRAIHDFIDFIQPLWTLNDGATLNYVSEGRILLRDPPGNVDCFKGGDQLSFIRIPNVFIDYSVNKAQLNNMLKEDLPFLRGTVNLTVYRHNSPYRFHKIVQQLKPRSLFYEGTTKVGFYELLSQRIPDVGIFLYGRRSVYLMDHPTRMFEIGKIREKLYLSCCPLFSDFLGAFLTLWVRGTDTGILKQLTLRKRDGADCIEIFPKMIEDLNIQDPANWCEKVIDNCYHLRRAGSGQITVTVDPSHIVFAFM